MHVIKRTRRRYHSIKDDPRSFTCDLQHIATNHYAQIIIYIVGIMHCHTQLCVICIRKLRQSMSPNGVTKRFNVKDI